MQRNQPIEHRLSDYRAPDYLIDHIDLTIDLSQSPVNVRSRLTIRHAKKIQERDTLLSLDGENLSLMNLSLNNIPVDPSDYQLTDSSLTLFRIPKEDTFYLEADVFISQSEDLFGYYVTEGTGLVKAETEGMRRIHFCLDRPDVLSKYTTTIIANKDQFPTLLSNGELLHQENLPDGKMSVTWHDDTPKPSYLFALVAGNFEKTATTYQTRSGRKLPIEFYVRADAVNKCDFAKEILVKAMKWDEETFDLDCDLTSHKIAGVDKYASGASEPTGLNLFNTQNLFSTAATKTDTDILHVAEVVSHEFFHYWTGDRVTIRDWFNLTFKEGLTTLRSAMFREKLFNRDLVRYLDGKNLNDRAPRPDTYTAVRSLYTSAAYDKGAAVFRMIADTMGEKDFCRGINDFLKHYDGCAITIEKLVDHLNHFSEKEIKGYLNWFTQPGTPTVTVTAQYDPRSKRYTLCLSQSSSTPDYQPRPIPVAIALYDQHGNEVVKEHTLLLTEAKQEFHFDGLSAKIVPSLLRGFSAPVIIKYAYTAEELMLLMQHDSSLYNRIEAKNQLINLRVQLYCQDGPFSFTEETMITYRALITDTTMNEWLLAEILRIPSEDELVKAFDKPDLSKIRAARIYLMEKIANIFLPEWIARYTNTVETPIQSNTAVADFDLAAASRRRLKFICLSYLMVALKEDVKQIALQLFQKSLTNNMTETCNALTLLCEMYSPETQAALDDFYMQWQNEPDALNYWFRLQASSSQCTPKQIAALLNHPAFDLTNPNKVYALLYPFMHNPSAFHHASGDGYQLLAKVILSLDSINPSVAARLVDGFSNWEKLDYPRQKMIYDTLMHLHDTAMSVGVLEAANRELSKGKPVPPPSIARQLFTWLTQSPVIARNDEVDETMQLNMK